MMTRILIELTIYFALLAFTLMALNLTGVLSVDWAFIAVLLLVPTMIGIFTLAVVIVHDAASTPEDRSKARLRRHTRNWGL